MANGANGTGRGKAAGVVIYTDGAALGNPGPGGYAAILRSGAAEKELSGGFRLTTNNRMEIMAAIVALEALKTPCDVVIYTDSQYLANAINKGWASQWKRRGWTRGRGQPALNPDLWDRLLALLDTHDVDFRWVRGHDGDPLNDRADRLAVAAAKCPDLPPDTGYRP